MLSLTYLIHLYFDYKELLKQLEQTEQYFEAKKAKKENKIEMFSPDKNTLNIYFKKGNKTLFKNIKNKINDKIK